MLGEDGRERGIRQLSEEETRAAFEADFIAGRVREFIARNPKASASQIQAVESTWRKTVGLGQTAAQMERQIHTAYAEKWEEGEKNMSKRLGDLYSRVVSESVSAEEKARLMSEIEGLENDIPANIRASQDRRDMAQGR